jgi:hypothetical protein
VPAVSYARKLVVVADFAIIRSLVRPAGLIVRASTLLSKFFGQIDLIGDRFLRLHCRDLLDLADEDSAHLVLLEIESIAEVVISPSMSPRLSAPQSAPSLRPWARYRCCRDPSPAVSTSRQIASAREAID